MRLGLRITSLVSPFVFLTAIAVALSGCAIEDATQPEQATTEPPKLLDLISLWAEKAEGKDVLPLREIVVSDGNKTDGKVSFEVNIHSWKPERYAEPYVMLCGIADQESGQIIQISVYGSAYGSTFTQEKIAYMRPYAEVMIGVMNTSLTNEECGAILDALNVSVECLAELEESLKSSTPEVERNGVRYSLSHWGSEEGGTVEVIATKVSIE